jgi:YD repeat-containing protein
MVGRLLLASGFGAAAFLGAAPDGGGEAPHVHRIGPWTLSVSRLPDGSESAELSGPGGASLWRAARRTDAGGRTVLELSVRGGGRSVVVLDGAGRPVIRTDEPGGTTLFTYDLQGRLVRTDFPDGTAELLEYVSSEDHRVARRRERDGKVTVLVPDAAGKAKDAAPVPVPAPPAVPPVRRGA